MKTAIEFYQHGETPLTLLVTANDGVREVLAEALAAAAWWKKPAQAARQVIVTFDRVFPGTGLYTTSQRQYADEVLHVDFSCRQVTDVNDNYSGGSFRKWIQSYDVEI